MDSEKGDISKRSYLHMHVNNDFPLYRPLTVIQDLRTSHLTSPGIQDRCHRKSGKEQGEVYIFYSNPWQLNVLNCTYS